MGFPIFQLLNRKCAQCGFETQAVVDNCPQCKAPFASQKYMVKNGYLQIVIGAILALGMTGLGAYLGKIMLFPASGGSRFTGTLADASLIVGIFLLVISVGVAAMVNGYWQIRYGRRNKYIVYFLIAFAVILFVGGSIARRLNRMGY